MTMYDLISGFIGTPLNTGGEIILYTISAILLIVVIDAITGIFHAIIRIFR